MKKIILVLFTAFGCNALVAQINNPADINNPNMPSPTGQITPSSQSQLSTNPLDLSMPSGTQNSNGSDNSQNNTNTIPDIQTTPANNSSGTNNSMQNTSVPTNTPPRKH